MKENHGMTGTSLHSRWKQIKRRTTKPMANGYKNYGGRGITMCQEWLDSFTAFRNYLGDPPTPKHTIERIDNNGGYEPGNVKWASYAEQLINRRPQRSQYGPGVRKTKDTFWAMITIEGKRKYLGSFKSQSAAQLAYSTAKEKYVVHIKKLSTTNDRHRGTQFKDL
jgi:hypothetical protein